MPIARLARVPAAISAAPSDPDSFVENPKGETKSYTTDPIQFKFPKTSPKNRHNTI